MSAPMSSVRKIKNTLSSRKRLYLFVIFGLLTAVLFPAGQPYAFAAEQKIALNVPSVKQIFSPADWTGTSWDYGIYDCLPASVSMVLQYLENQGHLTGVNTGYAAVRQSFRKVAPNAYGGIAVDVPVSQVPSLTNNAVSASLNFSEKEKWQEAVKLEMNAGYPVIATVQNWSLLAAKWSGAVVHSIMIYGIDDNKVYYIDPWDGGNYSMYVGDFDKAWAYKSDPGMANYVSNTFRLTGAKPIPNPSAPPVQPSRPPQLPTRPPAQPTTPVVQPPTPKPSLTPIVTQEISVPIAPIPRYPVNNGVISRPADIEFFWKPAPGATDYYLEFWQYASDPYNSGWVTTTSFFYGSLPAGAYYWRVKARNSAGEGEWSETCSFTIVEQEQHPIEVVDTTKPDGDYLSPADGSVVECYVSLSAWAQDDQSGVAEVHFTAKWNNKWRLVYNATSTPYEYQWDLCAAGVPDGDIELGLDIYDYAGNEFNLHTKHTNLHITKYAPAPEEPSPPEELPPPEEPQPPPGQSSQNLAPQASRSPDGNGSGNAFDGNLSTFWVDGLGHAFTLALSWSQVQPVSRIIVWDRPQNSPDNNQINSIVITLSNGVSGQFNMNSGGPRCIDVQLPSPQTINSVTLAAVDASGNNGLSEVEIWVGEKNSGSSCSNTASMP